MAIKAKPADRFFVGLVTALVIIGLFVFVSASLGILARNEAKFYNIMFNQLVLGVGLGLIGMYVASRLHYDFWQKYSFYIFGAAMLATALVFVPHIGFSHGGARRWLSLGPVSFQPAELLKIAFVMAFAAWLALVKKKANTIKYGVIPYCIFVGVCALLLIFQPDTKSLILIATTGLVMLFVSGIPWKYIFVFMLVGMLGLTGLALTRPYVAERIKTFINPSHDLSGSSFQLHQAQIAEGSGGFFGRGYGQSVQKFSYLPEPQGDSIFAVIGEEFGFFGSTILIILYIAFAMRGLRIAYLAPTAYSRLLATGIVILLTVQSFLNIASITGVIPLTGVPLVFVSQGGTSFMLSLIAVGIVINISKYQQKKT